MMFGPRCPKCRSSRIRRGYTPSPLLLRLIGIYNLLCDNCNLLFRGWAMPGTVPKHGSRKKKPPTQQRREAQQAKGAGV